MRLINCLCPSKSLVWKESISMAANKAAPKAARENMRLSRSCFRLNQTLKWMLSNVMEKLIRKTYATECMLIYSNNKICPNCRSTNKDIQIHFNWLRNIAKSHVLRLWQLKMKDQWSEWILIRLSSWFLIYLIQLIFFDGKAPDHCLHDSFVKGDFPGNDIRCSFFCQLIRH